MKTQASRLYDTIRVGLQRNILCGGGLLDCYNETVVTNGVSYTITTRIDHCNHYYVFEVHEG